MAVLIRRALEPDEVLSSLLMLVIVMAVSAASGALYATFTTSEEGDRGAPKTRKRAILRRLNPRRGLKP
jgi:hypothetical protein